MKWFDRLSHDTTRFLEDLFGRGGQGLGVVLLAAFAILLGENIASLYRDWVAGTPISLARLASEILLPLLIAGLVWALLQRKRRGVGVIADEQTIAPHRGLIWILTPNPQAREIAVGAIGHHQPVLTHVWVIGTFAFPGLAEAYEALQREVGARGWDVTWTKVPIDQPTIRAGHDAVSQVFAQLPGHFVANDVVADITGGLKPLSTGMFIACVDHGWQMSYVDTPRDKEGRPAGEPRYIALDVKFREDVQLENGGPG